MWFFKKRSKAKHLSLTNSVDEPSTFCMLPWVHLHALPNGNVLPCCVAPYKEAYGNIKDSSLESIWNSQKMKKLRLNMINNSKTDSCNRCYEIESYGGKSLRNQMNEAFSDEYNLVKKTRRDGALKQFKILYLDIRFSNICNLKCMGCSPSLSSRWEDDYSKLYGKSSEKHGVVKIRDLSDLFLTELFDNLKHVKRAYFAGGESLLMEEHYQCLNYFLENDKNDILLSYNTNLMVLTYQGFDIIKYWKEFKYINLSVSIDDIDEQGEYFRFGTKWIKLIENIKKVMLECPHIKIEVTCTVSLFNIGRLPEIHDFLYKNKIIDENGLYLNYLLDPGHLRSQNLPLELKNKIKIKLVEYIEALKRNNSSVDWSQLEDSFNTQTSFLESKSKQSDIENFRIWISKIDKIRGNDIRSVYPEIANAMGLE